MCLSIAVYAGYNRKNKLLLVLLTLWGLTGIKAIIFQAYEDVILLACGLYGSIIDKRGKAAQRKTKNFQFIGGFWGERSSKTR